MSSDTPKLVTYRFPRYNYTRNVLEIHLCPPMYGVRSIVATGISACTISLSFSRASHGRIGARVRLSYTRS